MRWLAAIWGPDSDEIRALRPGWERRALVDQGPYALGGPCDVIIGGSDTPSGGGWEGLGERVHAWVIAERVVLAPTPAVTDPAVTMVSLMRRNPALSHEEFSAHWAEHHAPLALRRHVGLVDYRQCVVTETLTADTPEIDGIALLGFAARDDFEQSFFDSDEGRAEIMADVARFMDAPGRETTLVGPPEAPEPPG